MVVAGSLGAAVSGHHDASVVVVERAVSSRERDSQGSDVELVDNVLNGARDVAPGSTLNSDLSGVMLAVSISSIVRAVIVVVNRALANIELEVLVDPATTASVVAVVSRHIISISGGTVNLVLLRKSDGSVAALDGLKTLSDGSDRESDTRTTRSLVLDRGQIALSPVDLSSDLEVAAVEHRLPLVCESAAFTIFEILEGAEQVLSLLGVHISDEVEVELGLFALGVELVYLGFGLLPVLLALSELFTVLVGFAVLASPGEELLVVAVVVLLLWLVILGVDEVGGQDESQDECCGLVHVIVR